MVVFGGGGGRDLVIVFGAIGNEKHGGVQAATLDLFSGGTAFGATASIISPTHETHVKILKNTSKYY